MSFLNPYKDQELSNSPQKLSLLYIEQAYFHRIQIKSISSMYKLNVKLKKPIILGLHSLPVLKYILEHSEVMNSILQMENIYEIRVNVPGYGIFNQKYQLQQISTLFQVLAQYCQNSAVNIKKIILEFMGWRTFSSQVITNIFKFVKQCETLQQFSLNLNQGMRLTNEQQSQSGKDEWEKDEQTFYGKWLFGVPQFQLLLKCISSLLPKVTLNKLELRFGAWYGVTAEVLDILAQNLKKIYDKYKHLKQIKLDLHGWAKGNYKNSDHQINKQTLQALFRTIQDFDSESSELLEIDMRYWPKDLKIKGYKDRFQYLSGNNKRKNDPASSVGFSMMGTNFMGSQLKSKIINNMKIQIKD